MSLFRGCNVLSLDSKGRLAIPSRFRERLDSDAMVITIKPIDPCLLLYPMREWLVIESKLSGLSDFEEQQRVTKQMILGHATDCCFDSAGRILLAASLRDYASLAKQVALVGLGNRFELWSDELWNRHRDEWTTSLRDSPASLSDTMRTLTL